MNSEPPQRSIETYIDLPTYFVRAVIPKHYNQPHFPKMDLCAVRGHQNCRGHALDVEASIFVCNCPCHDEELPRR